MAQKLLVAAALAMMAAISPLSAASPEQDTSAGAPAAGPDAKYCLRVDPFTGSHIETIQCWTREQWADQGVDVDKEWPKEGVKVIG